MVPFAAFTFGDALLTVLELAFAVMWIWVAIGVVLDIFRSHDLTGFGKSSVDTADHHPAVARRAPLSTCTRPQHA